MQLQFSQLELDRAMSVCLGECCHAGDTKRSMQVRLEAAEPGKAQALWSRIVEDLDMAFHGVHADCRTNPELDFDRTLSVAYDSVARRFPKYSDEARRKVAIYCIYRMIGKD